MKRLIYCLLSLALLLLGSCQSEEPDASDAGGKTTTSNDNAVKFAYSNTSPTVRTHYGTDGTVMWSHGDMIRIISPASDLSDGTHQHAHYTISESGGGYASGIFDHFEDASLTEPIYWNAIGSQHFHAYYPAESVGNDPINDLGSITNIDPVTGSACFHVPADQSLTAGIRPSASNHDTHPLAYAIAATKSVTVDEPSPVGLEFHDFMNVLRIHVYNPSDQPVKGVRVETVGTVEDLYLAGTARVIPPHDNSGTITDYNAGDPASYRHFTFDNTGSNIQGDEYAPFTPTPLSNRITATDAAQADNLDLYYDLYLLPQRYGSDTLQITVLMGNDDITANDIVKLIPTASKQSSIKNVRINVPVPDRVYMGAIRDNNGTRVGDLYFAIGNLIAEYSTIPETGANTPPDSYYIAGTVHGKHAKSQYTANDVFSGTAFLNTERDLFKSGMIADPNYWADNNEVPSQYTYGSSGGSHSGDAACDLATHALGGAWRTPTENEINDLTDKKCYLWEWQVDYKGNTGLNGYLVSTRPGSTPGISSGTPVESIFLPAVGVWPASTTSTDVADRGATGNYWSSTHNASNRAVFISFDSNKIGSNNKVVASSCLALRPVTNDPQ